MKQILERLDREQQRRAWLALPIAVFKRFGEHNGGRLVTAISYWSFFSIFPLLLAFVTILNIVLKDDPETRQDLVDGALGQVPVLGTQLADENAAIGGSALAIAVGVATAVWSGLAAVTALQGALDEIWDIPNFERPNGIVKRARAVLFLAILAVGLAASTIAIGAASIVDIGPLAWVAGLAITFVVDALILLATYWLLISGRNTFRELLPGVLGAAALIVGLQSLGTVIVQRNIKGASDTYGTFAIVIALLGWFFLVSRVILMAAELNAVRAHRLTPRSLVSDSRMTDGDRRAVLYDALRVQRDRRIGVAVSLDGDQSVVVDADEQQELVTAGGS
jgi:membrane protein